MMTSLKHNPALLAHSKSSACVALPKSIASHCRVVAAPLRRYPASNDDQDQDVQRRTPTLICQASEDKGDVYSKQHNDFVSMPKVPVHEYSRLVRDDIRAAYSPRGAAEWHETMTLRIPDNKKYRGMNLHIFTTELQHYIVMTAKNYSMKQDENTPLATRSYIPKETAPNAFYDVAFDRTVSKLTKGISQFAKFSEKVSNALRKLVTLQLNDGKPVAFVNFNDVESMNDIGVQDDGPNPIDLTCKSLFFVMFLRHLH
jgi:hypothetical protein